jgi:hypothetical protein
MKKLLPLTCLFLAACQLIVDVDVPREKERLVVNGVQTPGSPWKIDLTRSKYVLERDQFRPVTTATISVTDDNSNSFSLPHDTLYRYTGNFYPVPGRHYSLTVEAPGYESVNAEFTMPEEVKITDLFIDSANTVRSQDGYNTETPIEVTFTDPPENANYYEISMIYYFIYRSVQPDGTVTRIDTIGVGVPIHIDHPGLSVMDEDGNKFSDKIFDGQAFKLLANANINYLPTSTLLRYEVKLGSMSEEQYRYLETRGLQYGSNDDPFAQPVQVYSNINNGYGVLGGTTYHTFTQQQ